jgi:hypothetical protein
MNESNYSDEDALACMEHIGGIKDKDWRFIPDPDTGEPMLVISRSGVRKLNAAVREGLISGDMKFVKEFDEHLDYLDRFDKGE